MFDPDIAYQLAAGRHVHAICADRGARTAAERRPILAEILADDAPTDGWADREIRALAGLPDGAPDAAITRARAVLRREIRRAALLAGGRP